MLTKRTEILFLYEIENANPNGDPLNENRPRYDSEENRVLVSDVRLKRTIRDYWYEYKGYNGTNGKDIFVRETTYQDGDKTYVSDGKRRAKAFQESQQTVLDQCIDVRTFGGVLPLDKDSITLVGPTQFQMGKSINKTDIITEQGTGAFASGDKKGQATFRTEYKVPYALIGFNGIINEKAASYSQMTDDDKSLLLEGIWEGTKNLISRSKFGQTPLLLLTVDYNEPYYIGGLRQRLKLITDKNEMQLRSTDDYTLDVSFLLAELTAHKDKVSSVTVRIDPRLKTSQPLTNGLLTL
ncbi:type I-B CRISPR-associated protein Cas7/Csh2 [Spirosoma sp. SC4-14]|uniref:type I-B CRISPR-associated protein Cas7/Csh2 n=1 Tax=Spirosoma sp. SC4-14 TaxID=3128900 RepID=UPI0030CA682A